MKNDWKIPVIGITGSIGSGKSTVGRAFAELGGDVIDADKLLRYVTAKGRRAYGEIIRNFGEHILDAGGRIDRAALAAVVFKDEKKRAMLESITHVEIMTAANRRIVRIARKRFGCVFLEAALLVESGLNEILDGLVVVVCDEKVCIERLRASRTMTAGDIKLRLGAQMSQEEKARAADWVVENSGSLGRMRIQVKKVFSQIKRSDPYIAKKKAWGGSR